MNKSKAYYELISIAEHLSENNLHKLLLFAKGLLGYEEGILDKEVVKKL